MQMRRVTVQGRERGEGSNKFINLESASEKFEEYRENMTGLSLWKKKKITWMEWLLQGLEDAADSLPNRLTRSNKLIREKLVACKVKW